MLASREPGTNKIHLWSAETLELLQELAGHPVGVGQFDFSPDSRTLASAGAERTVKLWDVATGEEILTLEGYSWYVSIPRFSPDGGSLATSSAEADGRLVLSLWRTGR
jgi:WD40 repeat protein